MSTALSYRRSIGAAQKLLPLTRQFIHDSRTDVLKFSAGQWYPNYVGPNDPFRNRDVVTSPDVTTPATIDLRFTSGGQADEWVSMHMPLDSNILFKIYLNNELLIERATPGNNFLNYNQKVKKLFETTPLWNGDPFAYPSCILQPAPGPNHLQFIKLPASRDSLYFDGFGLNVRGGPLPATP